MTAIRQSHAGFYELNFAPTRTLENACSSMKQYRSSTVRLESLPRQPGMSD
jgi:hypothetical protein